MSTKQWTEKQTKEVMKKVIRRAEVSRIALLLQHRLALATIKQQNGWENLTLDAIEPKLEEDLKRKRNRIITSPLPTFSNQGQSGQQSQPGQPGQQNQGHQSNQGQQTQHGRKRSRTDSIPPNSKRPRAAPMTRPFTANPATVALDTREHREPQRPSTSHAPRISHSSPLQHGGYYSLSNKYGPGSIATFHSSPPRIESRIPRTPPRRLKSSFSSSLRDPRVAPRLALKPTGEEGADLLLYLATSPSPAVKKSGAAGSLGSQGWEPRYGTVGLSSRLQYGVGGEARVSEDSKYDKHDSRYAAGGSERSELRSERERGDRSELRNERSEHEIRGEGRFIPTTPPSRSSGAFGSIPQTPQTGFNFADFVNITPSPAPGFERSGSGSAYRGTPVEKARRRINFDGLAPPRQSPGLQRAGSSLGSMGSVGGDLVRG
ncbi:Similar to hypothetical protein [Tuber melanosporum Mel28]; acc. no. XP_002838462 [Pyronema omphalodes CBS 100304]|uniref:Uncharacterized protein n=1 Tax=Pyronema omphalodes (strain CBS 100304) TaxID=1076935 RepID=U4L297_PYROM|nr:Similar to hypothetical protein [Tuber melanosporum Mel28]; acc. no. XP_002838462 [Pyronema omphalodes CBS 100304]